MADGGNGYSERGAASIWCEADKWDPDTLPARPWLAIGYLLRGHVTTIIGPGGVSKSSLVLAYAVALALGFAFHGMRPCSPYRSLVYNVEDDADEQRRRLTAVLTSFGKHPRSIAGMIARTGPTSIGTLFDRDPETGLVVPTAALAQLELLIRQGGTDVLFVDPLAELHGSDENDNTAMRAIVAAFRGLAQRCAIAVVIIHHTRKGLATPGDPDTGRGASAIIGASRVVLTLTAMTPEEAVAFGMPETTRKHFFRLDGGKANYSSLTDCEWFERVIYHLPNGDQVAVPRPWQPPQDTVSLEVRSKLETMIRHGSPQGPWSPKLDKRPRSIKHAMSDCGIATTTGQQALLSELLRDGFEVAEFRDHQRKPAQGLRTVTGEPEHVAWLSRAQPGNSAVVAHE